MGIPILSDAAICMCPHGGRLQFLVAHGTADGADGQIVTIQDYGNAMIAGCALPPAAGGPCTTVLLAQDPLGQAMKVRGQPVATGMITSITDKGWPITVVNPGMSGASLFLDPSTPAFRRADFASSSVRMKQANLFDATSRPPASGTGPGSSTTTEVWKDVLSAHWASAYARRDEIVQLRGYTTGFGDGTPATLLIYEFDHDGAHDFVERITSVVQDDRVEAEWSFQYQDDVDDLPDKILGDREYFAPEYFFDLKVGGKSARSGLIEFVDWVELELADEVMKGVSVMDFVAYFADGSMRRGTFDGGRAKLVDIPPGRVHWKLLPRSKQILTVGWGATRVRRDEIVPMRGHTSGLADGTPATFRIYEFDSNGVHDPVTSVRATIEGGRVDAEWPFQYVADVDDLPDVVDGDREYHAPEYFFELEIEDLVARSGRLEFRDWIDIELVDEDGNPLPDERFLAYFSDGSHRTGRTDAGGRALLQDVPPGKVHITLSDEAEPHRGA